MEVRLAAQQQLRHAGLNPSGHRAERHTQASSALRTPFIGLGLSLKAPFLSGLPGLNTPENRVPRWRTRRQAVTLASQVQPLGTRTRSSFKPVNTAWVQSTQGLEGEETLAQLRALISRLRQVKNGWEGTSYWGVQPSREVRERTEGLLHRVATLQRFAEQHAGPDGTVPVQVLATMKALQRELGSLENIVRLANDSGATLTRSRGSFSGHVPSSFPVVNGKHRSLLQPVRSQELQHEAVKTGPGDGGRSGRGQAKSGRAYAGASEYEVSTPAGKGASPLAAFRKEIERRVIEQLSSKMQQQAPSKVDRGVDVSPTGDVAKIVPAAEPVWIEQSDWSWSGDSILDTGLVDRRQAEFDLGPSEEPRAESSFLASTSGSDTWNQQYVKGPEIVRQQKIRAMEDAIRTAESERLRLELSRMQAELKLAESSTARAKINALEAKVRQLELDLSRSVPLSIHDGVVKKLQGTVAELRLRIRDLEGIVRERELMITTVSSNLVAEREAVVRKMTLELSQRVTPEEVDRVVAATVSDVRAELAAAQEEVRQLGQSLDAKDQEMARKMQAWDEEKGAVNAELEATIKRMVTIEATVDERQAEVLREQVRAAQLEKELARLLEERDAFMAGAVVEKDALLQQVAVLERSLTGGESDTSSGALEEQQSVLGDLESEVRQVRQGADEEQTELERVRFELKGLMKVAEEGQIALVLQKVAQLLVSLSHEVGLPGATGTQAASASKWEATVASNKKAIRVQSSAPEESVSAAPLNDEQKGGFVSELRTSRGTRQARQADRSILSNTAVNTQLGQAAFSVGSAALDAEQTVLPPAREADPSAPEEEFIGVDDPEPAGQEGGHAGTPPGREVDPSAPDREFVGVDNPTPAGRESDETGAAVREDGSKQAGVLSAGKEEEEPKITLFYETGWETAYVHCSVDGQSWTDPPGLEMSDGVTPEGVPVKTLQVPAAAMEFVITDGTGDWDKPNHGGNYIIDHAGRFALSSGTIRED